MEKKLRNGMRWIAYDCLAASSTSLLARTAWRALTATAILELMVAFHGCKKAERIYASCARRALATLFYEQSAPIQAPERYSINLLLSTCVVSEGDAQAVIPDHSCS